MTLSGKLHSHRRRDQHWFPGTAGENTRIIYDLIQHAEENQIPGLLVTVDFEKAFDSVSWKFIDETLSFFNFGNELIKWIHLLNYEAKLCVIQHGFTSDYFEIGRGCRQGDPISPYLFILCAEIMAIMIRQHHGIKGIKVGHVTQKIIQYADDTVLCLDDSNNSLKNSLDLLEQFHKYSGLKPNWDKTHCMWIGSRRLSEERLFAGKNLSWRTDSMTILGIRFHINLFEMISLNYDEKIKQIKNILANWSKRSLTPLGRITVIKTFAISKLVHIFTSLPTPPDKKLPN